MPHNVTGPSAGRSFSTIAALKLDVNLNQNGDETWSGPANFDVSDIRVHIAGPQAGKLGIGKISARAAYDKLDMRPAQEISKAFRELFRDGKKPTHDEGEALLKNVIAKMPPAIGDVTSEMKVEDVSFSKTGADTGFTLGSLSFLGITKNMRTEKAAIHSRVSLQSLYLSGLKKSQALLAPAAINIELNIDSLPFKKALATILDALQKDAAAPQPADMKEKRQAPATKEAFAALPKILEEAGTRFSMQNTFARTASMEAYIEGEARPAQAAASKILGTLTLRIDGLDETIQKLKEMSTKPVIDMEAMNYAARLTALQVMGKPETGAGGKSSRVYAFEMAPDGHFLLNGADISLFAPGATKQAPPTSNGTPETPAPLPEMQKMPASPARP